MTTELLPHPLQPIASADGSWLPRMWDLALSATDREEDGNISVLRMIAASHGYEVQCVLQETPDELWDVDADELLAAVAPPADAPVAGMLVGRTIGEDGIINWYASRSGKFAAAFPAPPAPAGPDGLIKALEFAAREFEEIAQFFDGEKMVGPRNFAMAAERRVRDALSAAPTPPQPAPVKTLWCVHHIGPDDLHPVEDYEAAVKMADSINDQSEKFNFGHKPDSMNYVYSRAYPAPWPHSPESHAAGLARATSTGEAANG